MTAVAEEDIKGLVQSIWLDPEFHVASVTIGPSPTTVRFFLVSSRSGDEFWRAALTNLLSGAMFARREVRVIYETGTASPVILGAQVTAG